VAAFPSSGLPQKRRGSRLKKLFRGLLWGSLLLFLLYQGIGRLLFFIAWQALEIQQATAGRIEKTVSLEAVVVREETFLAAPADGTLTRIIPEGERVAAEATVARVELAGVAAGEVGVRELKAPFAGQVCYHPDGLEKVLQPPGLDNLDPLEVISLARRARPRGEEREVRAGVPVVRLVNNLQPLFLYAVLPDVPPAWEEKKRVGLRAPGEEELLWARVDRLYSWGDGYVLVLRIDKWGSRWLHPRVVTVEAVAESYAGMVVPRTALVLLEDGSAGVYCVVGRDVKWRQVEIVGAVGERAAVRGIQEGAEVVANPYWVRFLTRKSRREPAGFAPDL